MSGMNICAQLGGNVGESPCAVRMGRPLFIILTQGKVFSQSDVASSAAFRTALRTSMLLERGNSNKCAIFPIIREVEDATEDVETGTLADGYSEVLNEKVPVYVLRTTGSFCQAQSMEKFNGWTDKVFIVDDKRIIWYVKTDNNGAAGWSVGSLYTNPPRFAAGGAVVTTTTRLSFGSIEEFKGGVGALKLDFDPTKVANINDVELYEADAAAGYVFTVGGRIKCVDTNIYAAYKNLLATPNAWEAELVATGAPVDISSVAADDANEGWDITLDNDPAITTGASIIIRLKDPATLAALSNPVEGLESFDLVVTKAA